jgi:hypothetical protein
MTAAFDSRYDETIFRQACLHFGCEERTLGRYDIGAAKRDPQRTKKRKRLADTIAKFNAVMSSDNPPRTKDEAVKAMSPVVAYLLWSIFKMLVIQIIEWAWDRYAEQQAAATGERRDG